MGETAVKFVNESKGHLYLRKKGLPRVKLNSPMPPPGQETGSDLEREVAALILQHEGPPRPGTVKAATRAYELSPGFRGLAASTKYEYRLILGEFDRQLGALPLTTFSGAYILSLRDAWATVRGHRAANIRLTVLEHILTPAIVAGDFAGTNPFSLIKGVRRPADAVEPHVLWPAEVVTAVIEYAIKRRYYGLARAVAIARFAGLRRGDLVKLTRASRSNGRIAYLASKKRVPVNIEEDEELTWWLERTPNAQPLSDWQRTRTAAKRRTVTEPLTLVYNRDSKPYTEDGLGQALAKIIGEMADEKLIDSTAYDLHGLRHTRGVELALAGCTDAEGAAMLGHGSPNSFATYRRQADRFRLAEGAADKLRRHRERARNALAPTAVPTGRQPGLANDA